MMVLTDLKGGNIMLGGISFQLAIICFYAIFMVEFFVRWWKDKPVDKQWKLRRDAKTEFQYHQRQDASGKMKIMITALLFSSLCLFIRWVVRNISSFQKWRLTMRKWCLPSHRVAGWLGRKNHSHPSVFQCTGWCYDHFGDVCIQPSASWIAFETSNRRR